MKVIATCHFIGDHIHQKKSSINIPVGMISKTQNNLDNKISYKELNLINPTIHSSYV